MDAQTLTCPNCGKALDMPANTRAKIFCPSCDSEVFLPPGLQKNNEIAAKDSINSAIPIRFSFTDVQRVFAEIVAENPTAPLDLLSKTTVSAERRVCVSSYLFQCSANVTYNCEVGNVREYQKLVDGGKAIETGTRVEWSQMSSACSFNADVFCSGNKEMARAVALAYSNESTNSLEDIEEVSYDADVETYGFNEIQSNAFNNYVKPKVEGEASQRVMNSLQGRRVRNVSIDSCFINKDMVRVFLPVLIMNCNYSGEEYTLYSSATGSLVHVHGLPKDKAREDRYNALSSTVSKGDGSYVGSFVWAAILVALILYFGWWLWLLVLPALLVWAGIAGVAKHGKYIEASSSLKAMKNESIAVANEFLRKGHPLQGVHYENDKTDIFSGYQISVIA